MTDKPKDKIEECLDAIYTLSTAIERATEDIQKIADALVTLGLPCGKDLHRNNRRIWGCAGSIIEQKRAIIDARLSEAEQGAANTLEAALAGVEIADKQKQEPGTRETLQGLMMDAWRQLNEDVDSALRRTLSMLGTSIGDPHLTREYDKINNKDLIRWHGVPILEATYGATTTIRTPSPDSAVRIVDAVSAVVELTRNVDLL
jgi:hypothetical protein